VRFTGYRPDDPAKTGIPADSVLLTLEALPGHGMALYFGELPSSDKSDTLFTSHVSLPRAQQGTAVAGGVLPRRSSVWSRVVGGRG
jgi:hypothetical protein